MTVNEKRYVTINEKRDHSAQKSDSELCIPWDGACIALHNGAVCFAIGRSVPEL